MVVQVVLVVLVAQEVEVDPQSLVAQVVLEGVVVLQNCHHLVVQEVEVDPQNLVVQVGLEEVAVLQNCHH